MGDMERLTKKNSAGGYELLEGVAPETAVERLAGNVPSVCRVKLQPSSFHDLAHGDEITECPYCHRILITSEEGQA